MNAITRQLTRRIALDRTLWHWIRCTIGWHVKARWELTTFTATRKEGRKSIEFTVMVNVREAICCGKALNIERL